MKQLKPFNEYPPPKNRFLLVCFPDWGYRIAEYKKLGGVWVWQLQGNGRNEFINGAWQHIRAVADGDWHGTEDTRWCELPAE